MHTRTPPSPHTHTRARTGTHTDSAHSCVGWQVRTLACKVGLTPEARHARSRVSESESDFAGESPESQRADQSPEGDAAASSEPAEEVSYEQVFSMQRTHGFQRFQVCLQK